MRWKIENGKIYIYILSLKNEIKVEKSTLCECVLAAGEEDEGKRDFAYLSGSLETLIYWKFTMYLYIT